MVALVHAARELFAATELYRKRGEVVGLVPTMGALHDGHMSLVQAVRAAGAQRVVVSIFVNPLQFGPSEDFAKYPRTLDGDLQLCNAHSVDLVYAPSAADMYPSGFQTHVEVERVTQPLEGAARPTHFRGVTTVVNKLFNATGACIAAFGRKDYQQWRTLETMARDLDLPVQVLGCPIIREPDGLAMSSRNRYLNADERQRALAIHAGLRAASSRFAHGERNVLILEQLAHELIAPNVSSIDYVTIAHADDLSAKGAIAHERSVMLVAARLGATRLIDNAVLGQECLV